MSHYEPAERGDNQMYKHNKFPGQNDTKTGTISEDRYKSLTITSHIGPNLFSVLSNFNTFKMDISIKTRQQNIQWNYFRGVKTNLFSAIPSRSLSTKMQKYETNKMLTMDVIELAQIWMGTTNRFCTREKRNVPALHGLMQSQSRNQSVFLSNTWHGPMSRFSKWCHNILYRGVQ